MFPNLFGIKDGSYILCIIIGIIAAIFVAVFYFKKIKLSKNAIFDLLICTCFAVVGGIVFAILFENLYEVIALKESYKWVWKMTFFGGLFGGVIGFLITYYVLHKNTELELKNVVVIAPGSIALAHSIGRIGCFLAGCCYGKHNDSGIGMDFPGIGKVIPTQLFEAAFLLFLAIVLIVLAFKKNYLYNFVIYLSAYSIFRFIIEFYRGDERGQIGALSPSQIWCIILFVVAIALIFVFKKVYIKTNEEK